jgi:hypothetical protein
MPIHALMTFLVQGDSDNNHGLWWWVDKLYLNNHIVVLSKLWVCKSDLICMAMWEIEKSCFWQREGVVGRLKHISYINDILVMSY